MVRRTSALGAAGLLAALSSGGAAEAAVISMNFPGLQDGELVNDYYNGGTGSFGSGGGTNYGVSYVNATALNEADNNIAGLSGSPNAITFVSDTSMTMDVAGGFSTGLGFVYSAPFFGGVATIWSGLDGTGTLLASLTLGATPDGYNITGCNGLDYCPGVGDGTGFAGIAKSVEFSEWRVS